MVRTLSIRFGIIENSPLIWVNTPRRKLRVVPGIAHMGEYVECFDGVLDFP